MLSLLLVLWSADAPRAIQPPQPPPFKEEDRLDTRAGPVILEKREDAPGWRVRLKDRTLVENEDDELGLWEVFEGDEGHDYVIVEHSTGGIACPYQFRVIDVESRGEPRVSEEFGSCLEPSKTRLYGSSLVLEMRAYI